jgi:protein gp37
MKDLLTKVLPLCKFWTDAWSLVEGCTPVSPGCANCWLASMAHRFTPAITNPGNGRFNGIIKCHEERLDQPLRAKKPRVYAIWSDLFHEDVPVDFLNRAFDTMNMARRHRFIIITKRPFRAVQYLKSWPQWSPMMNVTILVTVEDQQRADERAPHLRTLAGLGWHVGALCEPLLGPVNLGINCVGCGHLTDAECPGSSTACRMRPPLSWIITGGESGHGARPAHPDWFRSLRDQAQAAGVSFMFKQWGEWAPCRDDHPELEGCIAADWDLPGCPQSAVTHTWGDHVFSLRAGKKNTGRELDGREWLEVP